MCLLSLSEALTSVLILLQDPVHVARAPGRLDVMGGIADYSGSLVLQLPLAEACHVAVQRHSLSQQRVWRHMEVRHVSSHCCCLVICQYSTSSGNGSTKMYEVSSLSAQGSRPFAKQMHTATCP